MFILKLFFLFLIFSEAEPRRRIDGYNVNENDGTPLLWFSEESDILPTYDITAWVRDLHLQQCAFVEIGDGFCALFVEFRDASSKSKTFDSGSVGEFFLGLCDCTTLRSWVLCPAHLMKQRRTDCIFTEATTHANTSARVHRRLCDVTLLSTEAPACNCSVSMADQQLYKTEGFPTCFQDPLPQSICTPRGVCGVANCNAITVRGIHMPRCARDCYHRQPFCEHIGPWTSKPLKFDSMWTRWSPMHCNTTCGQGVLSSTSVCYDQVTGKPAIDCLGPGSSCCPKDSEKCLCVVEIVDNVLRATRTTDTCVSTDGCSVNRETKLNVEDDVEFVDNLGMDDAYEYDDRYASEEYADYSVPPYLSRRRLLAQRYSQTSHIRNPRRRGPFDKHLSRNGEFLVAVREDEDDDEDDENDNEEDNEENEEKDEHEDDLTAEDEDDTEDQGEEQKEEKRVELREDANYRTNPWTRIRMMRSDDESLNDEDKDEYEDEELKGNREKGMGRKKEKKGKENEPTKTKDLEGQVSTEVPPTTEDCTDEGDETTEVQQYYDYEGAASISLRDSSMFLVRLTITSVLFLLG